MSAGEGVVPVIQADREAAWHYGLQVWGSDPGIKLGNRDSSVLVQAFARHRLSTANQGAGEWRVGDEAEYTALDEPLRVTIAGECEGWWEVRCSDGSFCIVRPSRLRRPASPTPPVRGGE